MMLTILLLSKRVKIIIIVLVWLLCLLAGAWYVWFRYFSAHQLQIALSQRDLKRAEGIWAWGVYAPQKSPFVELMRIIDRLHRTEGVKVMRYDVREMPVYGPNGQIATLDIHESRSGKTKEFGVGLRWNSEDDNWSLIMNYDRLPSYVRAAVSEGEVQAH